MCVNSYVKLWLVILEKNQTVFVSPVKPGTSLWWLVSEQEATVNGYRDWHVLTVAPSWGKVLILLSAVRGWVERWEKLLPLPVYVYASCDLFHALIGNCSAFASYPKRFFARKLLISCLLTIKKEQMHLPHTNIKSHKNKNTAQLTFFLIFILE